jgi:hypothetical protein
MGNEGYKHSAEVRKVMSEKARLRWANMSEAERARRSEVSRLNATHQMADPAVRARISAKQKGKSPAYRHDPEKAALGLKKHKESLLAYFSRMGKDLPMFQPDARAKSAAALAEDRKTNPKTGKFETNVAAREWHLRDPWGNEYHFFNLLHFIRTHPHLFTDYQLGFIKGHEGREEYTRAFDNLGKLSPRRTHPKTSSMGWTWCRYAGEPDPRFV